jgi:putative transposase
MKKRFSDEQIVGFLREAQVGSKTIEQLAREYGFSVNTYYVWKRKFGAMTEPDVKRARELEKENARLKRLLAERDVEIDVMKEIIEKKLPS